MGDASLPASWTDLPEDVLLRITSFLSSNEVACTVKLINRAATKQFHDCRAVLLSQPVPHHAFVRRWCSQEAMRTLTFRQRQRLLALTARSGSLINLQAANAVACCSLLQEAFDAAAAGGSLETCQWLADLRCPVGTETIEAASECGHLGLVRWLLRRGAESAGATRKQLAEAAWTAAAGAGRQTLCEGLMSEGVPCPREAVFAAARGGHVGLTEWLLHLPQAPQLDGPAEVYLLATATFGFDLRSLEQRLRSISARGLLRGLHSQLGLVHGGVLAAAIVSPTPDWRAKVEWLEGQGFRHCAAFVDWTELLKCSDCLERLQLLQQRGSLPDGGDDIITAAVRVANITVLWFLRDQGLLMDSLTGEHSRQAAETGHVEFLAELLALGCPVGEGAAAAAARGGHLHVLQWLGGPRAGPAGGEEALQRAHDELTAPAAESGSLTLMRWLREERGCPWHAATFPVAAGAGNMALLEWLAAQGCPWGDLGEAYVEAGKNGDLGVLGCLRYLGCPWHADGATICDAVDSGCSLEVLRWLVTEGCPVDWQQAKRHATAGAHSGVDGEVTAWLEDMALAVGQGVGAEGDLGF